MVLIFIGQFYKQFCTDICFNQTECRYEVKLPFKEGHDLLSDNYSHCVQRLGSLKRKFTNKAELLHSYTDIIKTQISSGVIEHVPSDTELAPGQVHYLPRRPVIREDKSTTKVRMVFDASSKIEGPSLNECLYPGSSITESLFGVLLRFRLYRYAFISDIEKAFLHISLAPEHREFARFLWFNEVHNLTSENINDATITVYRLCRVLFGVTSSPFLLSATIIEHMKQFKDVDFVDKFLKSLHVDDLSSGGDTINDVYTFFMRSKSALTKACFNLRKFESNSTELDNLVKPERPGTEDDTKILGLTWNKLNDQFIFSFQHLLPLAVDIPTKRELIRFLASIYDPLGLLNPYIVKLKILFQEVCVNKVPWDTKLYGELLSAWSEILQDICVASPIVVDRLYHFSGSVTRVEIHGFSDASLRAFGCVYLKVFDELGNITSSLAAAKSKVAPLEQVTIPRLELLGAVMLSELVDRVRNELSNFVSLDSVLCWVDSMAALHWICSKKKHFCAFIHWYQYQIGCTLIRV